MGCAVSYEKTNKKMKDSSTFHSPNTTRRLIEKTPVSPISAPVNRVEYPAAFKRKEERETILDSDKDSFKDVNIV